ncbi:MAG TPA: ABC transporter ATP-binding protein [Chloroflexota bacterium]|nr:ABC transporter ATP-binding protein [Chloroflexota bacterium]
MFELRDLHAYYGKSHVVQGINLTVNAGEAVALTGRNGVGKTTTLRSVMGLLVRTEGSILLEGQDISRLSTPARANRGIGYVPEERAVFPTMSVEENIMVGALVRSDNNLRKSALQRAYEFFPLLRQRHRQMGGTLSGGQQKMLALARGLALQPRLLLVDEPSEGLMPANVDLVAAALAKAASEGMAIVVVDASFDLLRTACSRLYIMDLGRLVGEYKPTDFATPQQLAAAYLGEQASA